MRTRRDVSYFVACVALFLAIRVPLAGQEPAPAPAAGFQSERISVDVRGTGADVILIHGLAGHRDVWGEAAPELAQRYRLHLVQIHGFGGVPAGANADGPVLAPLADEVARYATEARLDRPAVIGHSMGGTIGMLLALRHPERVGRLMVMDMPPFLGSTFGPSGSTPEGAQSIADGLRQQILSPAPGDPDPLERMTLDAARPGPARDRLLRHALASDRRVVANAFHELIVTDLRQELASLAVPVTLLFVVPPAFAHEARAFEADVAEAYAPVRELRVVRVEDSLHYIQLDRPDRFVAEVDAFMTQ